MRKILLFIFIVFMSVKSFGQTCIPDPSYTTAGIYPDSMPHAYVNHAYSATLQVRVPLDTTVVYLGSPVAAKVDSVIITSVAGLPAGITYACNPTKCTYYGGTNGCANFYGTAPASAGNYPLQIFTTTYGHPTVFPGISINQKDTIVKYHITVETDISVATISSNRSSMSQNHPNPFGDQLRSQTLIEFYSASNTVIPLKVSNILGKIVYSKNIAAVTGTNRVTLDAKDFQPGIYFYTIGSETRRMIVDSK